MSAIESPVLRELLLALADDELCVGQNHAYWSAVSPFLEEDLAFTSIAQDELGHARAVYQLLVDSDQPRAVDDLAYGRDAAAYRSAHIAEDLCHDWSRALVRHAIYDLAERVRWDALAESRIEALAGTAQRAAAEEQFHRRHAIPLLQRLLGTAEGIERLTPLVVEFAAAGQELFELDADDDAVAELVADGLIGSDLVAQRTQWQADVVEGGCENTNEVQVKGDDHGDKGNAQANDHH